DALGRLHVQDVVDHLSGLRRLRLTGTRLDAHVPRDDGVARLNQAPADGSADAAGATGDKRDLGHAHFLAMDRSGPDGRALRDRSVGLTSRPLFHGCGRRPAMATRLDEIDLFDPDVYVEAPPHDTFALLRREAPVHHH